MTFLVIFLPSLVATAIHLRVHKTGGAFDKLFVYCAYTIAANLLTCAIVSIFFSSGGMFFTSSNLNAMFSIKYIVLSTFCAATICGGVILYKKMCFKILLVPDTRQKTRSVLSVILLIFGETLTFFSIFILFGNLYLKKNWGHLTFEEVLIHLLSPLKGAGTDMVLLFVYDCALPTLLTFTVFNVLLFIRLKKRLVVRAQAFKRHFEGTIWPIGFLKRSLWLSSVVFFVATIFVSDKNFNMFEAVNNLRRQSYFIENQYIDPAAVEIVFPEKKRNLIYIYVESYESTYLTEELGGVQPVNLIPEVTRMMKKNTTFSNNELLGGGIVSLHNGDWTTASIVNTTSGLPLKLAMTSKRENVEILPKAYTLGQILEDNGYNNVFMMGSDAAFAGKKAYLDSHGNYMLLDYPYAKATGVIPEDYLVWWGFEDAKLYAWAKETATHLAENSAPFNLSLLTVDTHHIGGYVCELCRDEHDSQYANVISCASRQLYDFVSWVKRQDFYENTTIVIMGDHQSMDPYVFADMDPNYVHRIINIFINPLASPGKTTNKFASLYDMFPSTLAALGAEIPGERLGLGTNLFADIPTLYEENPGMASEIRKFSSFYAERFW